MTIMLFSEKTTNDLPISCAKAARGHRGNAAVTCVRISAHSQAQTPHRILAPSYDTVKPKLQIAFWHLPMT